MAQTVRKEAGREHNRSARSSIAARAPGRAYGAKRRSTTPMAARMPHFAAVAALLISTIAQAEVKEHVARHASLFCAGRACAAFACYRSSVILSASGRSAGIQARPSHAAVSINGAFLTYPSGNVLGVQARCSPAEQVCGDLCCCVTCTCLEGPYRCRTCDGLMQIARFT
eukprot:6186440-Pleurochrysis_carterae.AAC.6